MGGEEGVEILKIAKIVLQVEEMVSKDCRK